MIEATEDDIAAVIVAAQTSNSSICAAALQQKFVITRRTHQADAKLKVLANLVRFLEDATMYELEHPSSYSPYLDAKDLLDAVGDVGQSPNSTPRKT